MPAAGAGRGGDAWDATFVKKIGQAYLLGPYLGCKSTLCLFSSECVLRRVLSGGAVFVRVETCYIYFFSLDAGKPFGLNKAALWVRNGILLSLRGLHHPKPLLSSPLRTILVFSPRPE